jgi:large subunit ribosomal protein L25
MTITIKAELRTNLKKGSSRKLRTAGKIPAILYGNHETPIAISLERRETEKLLASGGWRQVHSLTADPEGSFQGCTVMFKAIQRHPLSNDILHLDLYKIHEGQQIVVAVPVNLVGKPIGVAEQGGTLQFILRNIHIKCLPENLPDHLDVNIEALGIGDIVSVKDVTCDPSVTIVEDISKVIASVVIIKAAKAEEAAKEAAAEVSEEAAPKTEPEPKPES